MTRPCAQRRVTQPRNKALADLVACGSDKGYDDAVDVGHEDTFVKSSFINMYVIMKGIGLIGLKKSWKNVIISDIYCPINKSKRNEYCDTQTDRLRCSNLLPGPPPSAGHAAALVVGVKGERNMYSVMNAFFYGS